MATVPPAPLGPAAAWASPTALPKEETRTADGRIGEDPDREARSMPDVPDECCYKCSGDYDCDDGVDCSDDACVDHACAYTPDDEDCADGKFCNGEETCDKLSGHTP